MSDRLGIFTAAQIARVLGVTPQAMRQRLARVPADGVRLVSGNATNAWRLDSLPSGLRDKLAAIALNRGCSDPAQLFQTASPAPALPPLSQYSPGELEAADKLRRALLPALERKDSPLLSPGELDDILVRNYELAFGHTVTAKHARNLMNRAMARDQGRHQWQRIDLYITEQPKPAPAGSQRGRPDFMAELGSLFERYATAPEFGIEQRAVVWDALFRSMMTRSTPGVHAGRFAARSSI